MLSLNNNRHSSLCLITHNLIKHCVPNNSIQFISCLKTNTLPVVHFQVLFRSYDISSKISLMQWKSCWVTCGEVAAALPNYKCFPLLAEIWWRNGKHFVFASGDSDWDLFCGDVFHLEMNTKKHVRLWGQLDLERHVALDFSVILNRHLLLTLFISNSHTNFEKYFSLCCCFECCVHSWVEGILAFLVRIARTVDRYVPSIEEPCWSSPQCPAMRLECSSQIHIGNQMLVKWLMKGIFFFFFLNNVHVMDLSQ